MKILLRMEGAVNGKPFVVNGIGDGRPNQYVKVERKIVVFSCTIPLFSRVQYTRSRIRRGSVIRK